MELATLDILDRLVAFASVSSRSNRDIAGWIEAYLRDLGFDVRPVPSPDDQKVGLFARIGPSGDGGLLLSGHMDVVPVEGQDWTREHFRLTRAEAGLHRHARLRLFGRIGVFGRNRFFRLGSNKKSPNRDGQDHQ